MHNEREKQREQQGPSPAWHGRASTLSNPALQRGSGVASRGHLLLTCYCFGHRPDAELKAMPFSERLSK